MTNNLVIIFTASAAPEKFADTNLNFLLPAADFRDAKKPVLLPMIVNWPGKIPADQVSDSKWTAADFAPTALEMALGKAPKNLPGHSMLPVLLGKKTEPKVSDALSIKQ